MSDVKNIDGNVQRLTWTVCPSPILSRSTRMSRERRAAHPVLAPASAEVWPSLPLQAWQETYATLHMETQIVGKIRSALTPRINHWWNVTLYVSSCGLTTSPIPYGSGSFEITFDFLRHRLLVETTWGESRSLALAPRPVAEFYRELMASLADLGIQVSIWTTPVEIPNPIPFEQDQEHRSYDPEYAQRFWRLLIQADRVMTQFRSRFLGKSSPVHFFWGSFDLAVTRFSGRPAPPHPGAPNVADSVTREAYSHEVSSCGFWPGGMGHEAPVFYAYAYAEPDGFAGYPVQPQEAYFDEAFHEFLLPYDSVRTAKEPDELLLAFLQSTYEAAANLGGWDRAALERAT
jgi:hypothetical protein